MKYEEALLYLKGQEAKGSILGLENIKNLLEEMGNPQNSLSFIHVAGTNGKGSVVAFLTSILTKAGYTTGTYSSPALVSHLDSYQINKKSISQETFTQGVEAIKKAVEALVLKGLDTPTVFEMETAIAFWYFKEYACDIVVLETGMGGALDATNVISDNLVSVFSPISIDHTNFLGNTLEEIAGEKAGIIKAGSTIVTGIQDTKVLRILEKKAVEKNGRFIIAENLNSNITFQDYKEIRLNYRIGITEYKNLIIPFGAPYQIQNLTIVLHVVEALKTKGFSFTETDIREGILSTVWFGRFTCKGEKPVFVLEGAHNLAGVIELKKSIDTYFKDKNIVFIMGVFFDKEYKKMLKEVAGIASYFYAITPDNGRGLAKERLLEEASSYFPNSQMCGSLEEAYKKSVDSAGEDGVVVVFGSLSFLHQMDLILKKYNVL